jgi:hypothetical protein
MIAGLTYLRDELGEGAARLWHSILDHFIRKLLISQANSRLSRGTIS